MHEQIPLGCTCEAVAALRWQGDSPLELPLIHFLFSMTPLNGTYEGRRGTSIVVPETEDPNPSFPDLCNDEVPLSIPPWHLHKVAVQFHGHWHGARVVHEQCVISHLPVEASARIEWLGIGHHSTPSQTSPLSSF